MYDQLLQVCKVETHAELHAINFRELGRVLAL